MEIEVEGGFAERLLLRRHITAGNGGGCRSSIEVIDASVCSLYFVVDDSESLHEDIMREIQGFDRD